MISEAFVTEIRHLEDGNRHGLSTGTGDQPAGHELVTITRDVDPDRVKTGCHADITGNNNREWIAERFVGFAQAFRPLCAPDMYVHKS